MPAPLKRIVNGSAVDRVAQALRGAVLARDDGAFLGSEEALLNQLGVSGPTLRQAARLLESEQLLEIKRGIGGGYYGRRPTMDVVTRMAATYLQTQAVGVEETVAVVGALIEPLTRLAAQCEDAELREELRTFEPRMAGVSTQQTEVELTDLIARMAGNVALRMVLTIFNSYGFMREKRPTPAFAGIERYVAMRPQLIEAILRRDADAAAELAVSRFSLLRGLSSGSASR